MKRLIALLLAAAMLFGMSGCTLARKVKSKIRESRGQLVLNVCNIVHGNLGDDSFFDSCEAGLKALEKSGIITHTTLELGASEKQRPLWLSTLYEVCESGEYDLIICGGSEMEDFVKEVAAKYPKQYFLHYDDTAYAGEFPNIVHLGFKQNEAGYLVGVYAGLMEQQEGIDRIHGSNTVGFVGGVDSPVINDFLLGFIQGAQSVNPDIKVDTRYTNDYSNTALAKEYTLSMIDDNHCEIIWGVCGRSGVGAAEASQESGKSWFIGVDSDQELSLPKEQAAVTLTSGIKDIGGAICWVVEQWCEGKTYWGKAATLGVAEGSIDLVTDKNFKKYTPKDVQKAVEEIRQKLIDGEIKVDSAYTEEGAALAVKLREQVRP